MDVSMDVNVGRAIMAAQPRGGSQRVSAHDSDSKVSPPRAIGFKETLNTCLGTLKYLVEMALEWSKLSRLGETHFDPLATYIEAQYIRLKLWASIDIEVGDPDFGDWSPSALMKYMTNTLEQVSSSVEEIAKKMEIIRSLATGASAALSPDSIRVIQESSSGIDEEKEKIAIAVRTLVSLTEAVHIHQAVTYQNGPLAGRRREILATRNEVETRINLQRAVREVNLNESAIRRPIRRTASFTSSEDPSRDDALATFGHDIIDVSWTRKTLLTLDGGGTRSYSSLLVLEALMREIARQEQQHERPALSSASPLLLQGPMGSWKTDTNLPNSVPSGVLASYLPCHYFDYIAGTSSGGIIAIMLGRLRMRVDECLEAFLKLLQNIWAHPRIFSIRREPFALRHKYDDKVLEKELKSLVKKHSQSGFSGTSFMQPNEDMCRTIVVASKRFKRAVVESTPYLFRSYQHPGHNTRSLWNRNPDTPNSFLIWWVGRVALATPSYFKAVPSEPDKDESEYTGVGFGIENPTKEAYESVKQLSNNNSRALQTVISIGSGKNLAPDSNQSTKYRAYLPFSNAAKSTTHSEGVHHAVHDMTNGIVDYFRLNVEYDIDRMKFDVWEGKNGINTLGLIRDKTDNYLNSVDGKQQISNAAKLLISVRRARASEDPDRWERFCHGVEYKCPVEECTDEGMRWAGRRDLRSHLEERHGSKWNVDTIEALLDAAKKSPLYQE